MVNTTPTPEEVFGTQLRRLREHAGLTVRALADELHRAHSGIVEYEGGRRLPRVEVVEQYEDYFEQPRGTLIAQRERARMLRLEDPRDATSLEHLGTPPCPYPGLRAFQRHEAALFVGREAQIECVAARLASSRFIAVVGASGSGKSSFVRAGLLAAIETASPRARVALLTPGGHPLDALAAAIGDTGAPRHATPDASGLSRRLQGASEAGLVVVVDQLEELFTLCQDPAERTLFVDALLAAWRSPASRVTLVLALRSDVCRRLDGHPELAAAVAAEQTLIGPMSPGDLRRAIELPAAASGLTLQPGFAETLLEDLADQPGMLALMAHALRETWKRRRRLTLTIGGYREAGGVRGAIEQTAERSLRELSEADRIAARSILLRLTDIREGAGPTGMRVGRSDLTAPSRPPRATDRILDALAAARLVTLDASTVAFAHEATVRHWPRLRGWIDEDRDDLLVQRRLGSAAGEWAALGRDAGALYRGPRLAAARAWATERGDGLSPLEREFLAASETAERRELRAGRRRVRRWRWRSWDARAGRHG